MALSERKRNYHWNTDLSKKDWKRSQKDKIKKKQKQKLSSSKSKSDSANTTFSFKIYIYIKLVWQVGEFIFFQIPKILP